MGKVSIRSTKKGKIVYKATKEVGSLHKFCCGTDFKLKDYPNALFSIINVRHDCEDKLIEAINKIMTIKIPNLYFHWNFGTEVQNNENAFNKYKYDLENLK